MAGYQPYQPYRTTPSNPYGFNSTQPVYPGMNTDVGGGGAWDWVKSHLGDIGSFVKDNWKDVARTGADAAGAYLDYDAKQQALKQQREQFEKQYGLASNAQAASVAQMINRAPLADKGQYLAMHQAAPTPYQPRDFTKGLQDLQRTPTGGAQAQLEANAATQANYKSGMGGVDTSTLKMILERLNMGGQTQPGASQPPAGEPPALPPGARAAMPANAVDPSNPYNFPPPERPTLDQVYKAWEQVNPGKQPPSPTSGELMRFWQAYRQDWLSKHGGQ